MPQHPLLDQLKADIDALPWHPYRDELYVKRDDVYDLIDKMKLDDPDARWRTLPPPAMDDDPKEPA